MSQWTPKESKGFSSIRTDGKLRHPRFEGLRPDKKPTEVLRESDENRRSQDRCLERRQSVFPKKRRSPKKSSKKSWAEPERFLQLLKHSPEGAVFNPWWQVDIENDIGPEAAVIRRDQLCAYLSIRMGAAQIAVVGEGLGYRGGHFTGIAMTSERMLIGTKSNIRSVEIFSEIEPRRTSKTEICRPGFSEPTASIVWGTMLKLGVPARRFVLWNIFPWHAYNRRTGMLSNRAPTNAELAMGVPVLQHFLKLFDCKHVVALGRLAAAHLPDAIRMRHPASGGVSLFRRQIAAFVTAHRHLFGPL